MKLVINEGTISKIISDSRYHNEFPFIHTAHQKMRSRRGCASCRKRMNAKDFSRLCHTVKEGLLSLSPARMAVFKKIAGADTILIYTVSHGTAKRHIK